MIDTPRGVKSFLYQDAARYEIVERTLLDLFSTWGYSRTVTPAIEYLHTLSVGLDKDSIAEIISFTDPTGGGRPLALRYDVTPQIARMAATTLSNRPLPLRFSYAEPVYRSATYGQGKRTEFFQAGVELLGVSEAEADAEAIRIAFESLSSLDFNDVNLTIGHIGYLRALIDELGLDQDGRKAVKDALKRKESAGLLLALKNSNAIKNESYDALLDVVGKFGGVEILDSAPQPNEAAKVAISNLRDIVTALDRFGLKENIVIDLLEARGVGYYTGITFEGFAKGVAWPILRGGRYDNLAATYGKDLPAVGFAIVMGRVIEYLADRDVANNWSSADVLVIGAHGAYLDAASFAKYLRGSGIRAVRDIIRRPIEESMDMAKRMNIPFVAIIGDENAPGSGMVKMVNMKSGVAGFSAIEEAMLELLADIKNKKFSEGK